VSGKAHGCTAFFLGRFFIGVFLVVVDVGFDLFFWELFLVFGFASRTGFGFGVLVTGALSEGGL
jgi:hypothetical protein